MKPGRSIAPKSTSDSPRGTTHSNAFSGKVWGEELCSPSLSGVSSWEGWWCRSRQEVAVSPPAVASAIVAGWDLASARPIASTTGTDSTIQNVCIATPDSRASILSVTVLTSSFSVMDCITAVTESTISSIGGSNPTSPGKTTIISYLTFATTSPITITVSFSTWAFRAIIIGATTVTLALKGGSEAKRRLLWWWVVRGEAREAGRELWR